MVRENQKDNPAYSFLFGGDGHNYYRYALWLATRPPGGPFNPPFPSSSLPVMHPPNPMVSPSPPNAPKLNASVVGPGASSSLLNAPPLHQPPFPPFYEQKHSQPFPGNMGGPGRQHYDQSSGPFKGLAGPLPSDVAMELNNVLNGLTGTKESIKGAKLWFMQRSPFAPALAEALRDRVYAVDDSERQLHILFLSNDILFDSLQRRTNTHDLSNEALAFRPVLGSMLARIYHNPQNKEENQERLQKVLQFWASKEVYDKDTIRSLENEMMGGLPTNSFVGHQQRDFSSVSADPSTFAGHPHQASNHNALHWQSDKQNFSDQEHLEKQVPSLSAIPQQFPAGGFPGAIPMMSSAQPSNLQSAPHLLPAQTSNIGEKLPPYPLFPPGLIPGMVRKMQIGSGVPYSPMSPLDIPTMIPPSTTSPSELLERVSKFFREIGEVNPSEGPLNSADDDDEYERDSPVRKGGTCIPPPPNLQVDPETGTLPDGSVERKPGSVSSGRLGLGATANPNEASQYDDVYSSYRKQRSTNYHTSMSARSATATTR